MGLFLYYLSGVAGIFLAIASLGCFSFHPWLLPLAVPVFCGMIWAMGRTGRRFPLLKLAVAAAVLTGIWLDRERLIWQCRLTVMIFQEAPGALAQADLTDLFLLFMALMAVFLYWLTFILKKGWLFYPVTALLVSAHPLLGGRPDLAVICLLAFYHLGDRAAASCVFLKKQEHVLADARGIERSGGRSMLYMILMVLLCLLAAYGLTTGSREALFQLPLTAEQHIRQTMELRSQLSTAQIFQQDGRVSRGNRQVTGRDVLTVEISRQPQETIYLKNFTGASYDDGLWQTVYEGDFLASVVGSDTAAAEQTALELDTVAYRRMADGQIPAERLSVTAVGTEGTGFVPYVSALAGTAENRADYGWYSLTDFLIWAEQSGTGELSGLEQAYSDYVAQAYTLAETNRFPRLWQLCQENPVSGAEEAVSFVRETLAEQASYTTTPGLIPPGQEIPEYFLFEGREGYCVHFATTAVLMFRMYGIPARYVSGYIAPSGEFVRGEDGSWSAVLSDRFAHAWPEIYIEGLGWLPVEVTPASGLPGGTAENLLSEEETASQEEERSEAVQPEDMKSVPETETDAFQNGAGTEEMPLPAGDADSWPGSGSDSGAVMTVMILLAAAAAAGLIWAVWTLLKTRRIRRLRSQQSWSAGQFFTGMIYVLRFGGYQLDPEEGEAGCAKRLSDLVPDIAPDMAERVLAAVSQEAFGSRPLKPEELEETRRAYRRTCHFVWQKLNRFQKWCYRYIRVFGP